MLRELLRKYNYCGRNYNLYKIHREEICEENLTSVCQLCIIGIVLSLLVLVTSVADEVIENSSFVYSVMTLVLLIIWRWARTAQKRNWVMDRAIMHVFYLVIYSYSMYVCIFVHKDMVSASFFVFLVLTPLFFVDEPYIVNIYQICAATVFCVLAYFIKNPDVAYIEILNCITFTIVAVTVYYKVIYGKVQTIEGRAILEKEKDTDSLTHILNRGGAEGYIRSYLDRDKDEAAMLLIDIDNFKDINDEFGHDAGDKLLIETAKLLQEPFRATDIYGRLGGDEFVIFLPKIKGHTWLNKKVDKLEKSLERTLIGDTGTCDISASIGVVYYPEDGRDFDQLYKHADEAMYEAKKQGKSSYRIYREMNHKGAQN